MEQIKVFVQPYPDDSAGKSLTDEVNRWLTENAERISVLDRKVECRGDMGIAIVYFYKVVTL